MGTQGGLLDAVGRWDGCGYKPILHKPGVGRDKKVRLLYSPEEGALLNLELGETRRQVPCTLQRRVLSWHFEFGHLGLDRSKFSAIAVDWSMMLPPQFWWVNAVAGLRASQGKAHWGQG